MEAFSRFIARIKDDDEEKKDDKAKDEKKGDNKENDQVLLIDM